MKIVFMGTPEFAVASLDILVKNGYTPVGVVTSPDKPAGRGQQIHQSAVKQYAVTHHLQLLQPVNLKEESFLQDLKKLGADLQIVVAFRMLPEAVWSMPALGTFNLHASLLPKYRGAAPINWAIINGEKVTGVTTFKLKHEIDTGNILFQESVAIGATTTAGELHDQLMVKGAELVLKTVKEIEKAAKHHTSLSFKPQKDEAACHAPKLNKETGRIDWTKNGETIYNFIRGLSPYPSAFSFIGNGSDSPQQIKVFKAEFEADLENASNGSLYTDNKTYLKVRCGNGMVSLLEVQLQGKKRMMVEDFLRGYKVKIGAKFI